MFYKKNDKQLTNITKNELLKTTEFKRQTPHAKQNKIPVKTITDKNSDETLFIASDIKLKGEINDCVHLSIEGELKTPHFKGEKLTLEKNGAFHGIAEVEMAEIFGKFEGELKVSGLLIIRAGGIVTGQIEYGDLFIERGGNLIGSVTSQNTDFKDISLSSPLFVQKKYYPIPTKDD